MDVIPSFYNSNCISVAFAGLGGLGGQFYTNGGGGQKNGLKDGQNDGLRDVQKDRRLEIPPLIHRTSSL